MRRVISVLSLAVLCLLCTACGWTKPVPLPEEDAISEAPALTRDLPVAEALPYGAFLETHREADGSAVQYARSNKYQPSEFSLVRRWENGGWTDWTGND